ncbi:MAG TPA: NHLP leader peptide family RiPP precursor [Stellaceae bacterium]|nr:NHLP leader peptide family RiPP precursor [Stellaceae bacterium]
MAEEATKTRRLSRRELDEKIIARAWTDDEFRRKFVADPRGQFEAHLGTTLPDSLKMTVHEETPDSLHFVIPQKPPQNLDELSDEDLERVAGGATPLIIYTIGQTIVVSLMSASVASATDWGK